jgi:hypothetical protein
MTKKQKKSSRKIMANRLVSYPQSIYKHLKQLRNHAARGEAGIVPKIGSLWA